LTPSSPSVIERRHELVVEPAAHRAQQVEADREADHRVHDAVRHDVQALQPLAADHRDRAVEQVARRRAEAAGHQRDRGHQHQQARAEAGHDGVRLFEMPVVEREQMLDLLAGRQIRGEQASPRRASAGSACRRCTARSRTTRARTS
jgi:hypothetical protein